MMETYMMLIWWQKNLHIGTPIAMAIIAFILIFYFNIFTSKNIVLFLTSILYFYNFFTTPDCSP